MVKRLKDHILSLSQMANLYHQKAYCELKSDGQYELKQEHLNTITRLSLNEFSLYGERPLSLDEFALVVEATRELAKNTHENVHLLLSSFSVINEDKEILNVVLYVQGGKEPKIDAIVKSEASGIDISYPDSSNFSQQTTSIWELLWEKPAHASSYVATHQGSVTSSNSLFEIATKGGARFVQGIDICLDNINQHSKLLLDNQLTAHNLSVDHLIPTQVDHIVTSNSVSVKEESKLSASVLHVDPRPYLVFDKRNQTRPIDGELALSSSDITSIIHYPNMTVKTTPGEITVTNPPFGSDYRCIVYQERKLEGFNPVLDSQIQTVNKQIMARKIDGLLESNLQREYEEFELLEKTGLLVQDETQALLRRLSQQCKPNFFEYLFSTQNYYLKQKAMAIIAEAKENIETYTNENSYMFLTMSSPWIRDMKLKFNNLNGGLPNSFTSEIKITTKMFQQKMEAQCSALVRPYIQ